jgi:site-specific DNA recombinase
MLDAAVWEDVRCLLSEPERVRGEYERRLQGAETGPDQEVEHLDKPVRNAKRMISRLIDAYSDGLLDKSEFEPRITAARERLTKLEAERRQRSAAVAREAVLRLVIGQLEEFARRVSQGLQEPDWETRREVVRALVKRVEIDEQEVRIVHRVTPTPFEGGPQRGCSQHCWGRVHGRVTEDHRFLLRSLMDQVGYLDQQIRRFDRRIAKLMAPLHEAAQRLQSIPGIAQASAQVIVAEIGVDMNRFPTPGNLASWAGMCPGNDESAGKRRSGRTTKGSQWLRSTLVQVAWAATHTKATHFRMLYARWTKRMGKKKALVALGHKILVIIHKLLSAGTAYRQPEAA